MNVIKGTNGVTVNYFDVSGCKNLPCIFPKNTNVSLKLNFTSSKKFIDYIFIKMRNYFKNVYFSIDSSIKTLKNLLFGTIAGGIFILSNFYYIKT